MWHCFVVGVVIAGGALVKWVVKYGPGRELRNWKPGFKSTFKFWIKFNMNVYFDVISKYTFDVISKTWFSVSKVPALARVYYPFYQHSCSCCPLTGKYARDIISRTFCNLFFGKFPIVFFAKIMLTFSQNSNSDLFHTCKIFVQVCENNPFYKAKTWWIRIYFVQKNRMWWFFRQFSLEWDKFMLKMNKMRRCEENLRHYLCQPF